VEGSKNLLVLKPSLCFHFFGFYWRNGDMKQRGFFDIEEQLA
jgi:hypothetical protein